MALKTREFSALAAPLGVLTLVLAICAGAIYYTTNVVKQGKAELAAAQRQLEEASKQRERSGNERSVIEQYLPAYRELEQRGFVGEAQRVNWIDALRIANGEAQLYGANYEVGAPQPYAFAQEVQAGDLPVEQSLMKLEFGLLYEDDLLRFLRLLAAQNAGTFNLTQCTLQRLKTDVSRPTNEPTLTAKCDLAWVTIPAPAPKEEGS